MKAVILAAGFSSRIASITQGDPKTLIKIHDNKTVLDQILECLNTSFPESKKYLVTNKDNTKKFDGTIEKLINNKPELNNFYSVYIACKELNDNIVLINSDVVAPIDFYFSLKKAVEKNPDKLIILVNKHSLGEEEMKVYVKEGKVTRISKKLDPERAIGEYIGITYVPKKVLRVYTGKVEELLKKGIKNIYYEDVWDMLLQEGKIEIIPVFVEGKWTEIDTPEDYKLARKMVEENAGKYFKNL